MLTEVLRNPDPKSLVVGGSMLKPASSLNMADVQSQPPHASSYSAAVQSGDQSSKCFHYGSYTTAT